MMKTKQRIDIFWLNLPMCLLATVLGDAFCLVVMNTIGILSMGTFGLMLLANILCLMATFICPKYFGWFDERHVKGVN